MYKHIVKYSFILLVLHITACTKTVDESPVARVGEAYLYPSDISRMLPVNTDSEDSILLAGEYINKWVKQQLLIEKANENLTNSQKDVSRELEEYRNSLIIYRYKQELVMQRMDTAVSSQQVSEFYTQNQQTFLLDRCIVKAAFVKVPRDLADQELLKEFVVDSSEEGQIELRDYCMQYAKNFEIAVNNWIDFAVLNRNMPEPIETPASFLVGNKMHELYDDNYYYLLYVYDFILANDLAPLEYVENNIKNLILNQRKIQFLKEMENNIFTEGERQKKFKIYEQSE